MKPPGLVFDNFLELYVVAVLDLAVFVSKYLIILKRVMQLMHHQPTVSPRGTLCAKFEIKKVKFETF